MEHSPLLRTAARRTIVITGGNGGLGFECAKAVIGSGRPLHVILACRDLQAASAAISRLRESQRSCHRGPEVPWELEAMQLDLASLSSVRQFAKAFSERRAAGTVPPLCSLVLNAGLQVVSGITHTPDGFETTFGVNHLGHFLLALLLLQHLSAPARVVFVSSDTHDPATNTGMPPPAFVTARSLAHPKALEPAVRPADWGRTAYTTSKLCNVLCAYELGRRLKRAGIAPEAIAVAAFNPGLMPGTGLARDYSGPLRFAWNYILPLAAGLSASVRSTTASGASLARLAVPSNNDANLSISGKYFDGDTERRSSAESYDEAKALDLWQTSVELAGLGPSETIVPIA